MRSFYADEVLDAQVAYRDKAAAVASALPHPRDIEILTPVPAGHRRRLREEIAVDMRRCAGTPDVGLRKGLRY